jgi:hypothetical protein
MTAGLTLQRAEAVMVPATLQHRANPSGGKRLILWASIVAVAALTAGLMQTGVGRSFLQKAGLYQAPASSTSLAFTAPQSLPTRLSSAPTKMKVSFELANTSASPRSYRWSIMLERAGHDKRLAAGEVSVTAENHVTVARQVEVSCSKGRARVTVNVVAPAESIDFWMTCSSRKGGKRE